VTASADAVTLCVPFSTVISPDPLYLGGRKEQSESDATSSQARQFLIFNFIFETPFLRP
jgi:hypothetical protein